MTQRLLMIQLLVAAVAVSVLSAAEEEATGTPRVGVHRPADVRVKYSYRDTALVIVADTVRRLTQKPVLLDVTGQSDRITIDMPEPLPADEAAKVMLNAIEAAGFRTRTGALREA